MAKKLLKCPSLQKTRGFTLVELSIVIVIIGLIVASVVVGKSLVQQARLRSVISEYQKFDAAVNLFRFTYNALPGDMANANNFGFQEAWGGGDGNGKVMSIFNVGNGHDTEYWDFWSHLGQLGAKFLPGQYDSNVAVTLPDSDLAKALPKSATGAYWGIYRNNSTANWEHYYVLGASNSAWAVYGIKVSLSAKDLNSIDSKVDNGMPGTGFIRAVGFGFDTVNTLYFSGSDPLSPTYAQTPTAGNCTASGNASYDSTAKYNAGFDNIACIMAVIKRF